MRLIQFLQQQPGSGIVAPGQRGLAAGRPCGDPGQKPAELPGAVFVERQVDAAGAVGDGVEGLDGAGVGAGVFVKDKALGAQRRRLCGSAACSSTASPI